MSVTVGLTFVFIERSNWKARTKFVVAGTVLARFALTLVTTGAMFRVSYTATYSRFVGSSVEKVLLKLAFVLAMVLLSV